PRPEHLPDIAPGRMARREVEAVGLRPPLRIQRQGHLLPANRVVQGMPPILGPQPVLADLVEPLHADLAHARRHAPGLHRLAARQRILALYPRIARDALLAHPRRAPVHRLLIGALLHTFLIAPAPVLVDQHDPVLRALIDRLARTGRQTPRIRAVIADPLQVEEERLVLRQTGA